MGPTASWLLPAVIYDLRELHADVSALDADAAHHVLEALASTDDIAPAWRRPRRGATQSIPERVASLIVRAGALGLDRVVASLTECDRALAHAAFLAEDPDRVTTWSPATARYGGAA